MNTALIAMSGGVDSSVAAWIMVQKGFDCTGAMMKLYYNEDLVTCNSRSCCTLDDANDARLVANKLNIPFFVFNFTGNFKEDVIDRFVNAYLNGMTPNPCIDCNRFLKFDKLLKRAKELEKQYVVTGHYATIEKNNDRFLLKKGIDETKDQSYVLYSMTQEQLSHTIFPLGNMLKSEVREIALSNDFINAQKRDSQDICFAPNKDYAGFIENYTGKTFEKGPFLDTKGNYLGEHNGIVHYTIGQRKGLGIQSQKPLYICSISAKNNEIVVGDEADLYSKTLIAKDVNLIATAKIDKPMKIKARLRYKQQEQPATVWQLDEDTLRIEFDSPQRAITKGQAVVMYDDEYVVGGGTIFDL